MSEKYSPSHEDINARVQEANEHTQARKTEHHEQLKTPEGDLKHAHEIREDIDRLHAEVLPEESKDQEPVHKKIIHSSTEAQRMVALNKYLQDIRTHLKVTARTYSKFIHNPRVDSVSEVAGKTVVRPTAILFAGFFMFAGSAFYLYITVHTNAKYNFFVAFFLFIGGFLVGLIVELFYKLFFKRDF